jgi:ribosomal protein S18 acetylase RimI-like enzyme
VVRRGEPADADAVGRLLHDFNVEFDDVTPGPETIAERMRELITDGDATVFLGGDGPDGLVVMRFAPSLYVEKLECYVAELYVVPDKRGRGLGRELMEAALAEARRRDANYVHLGTSDDDVAARALYEKLGFTNREGGPDGPVMYVYEQEL